jgi:hypothetical protein
MGDYVFPFEKLDVWRLSVDLAAYVLDLLEDFAPNKHIRVVGQMEAAVTSPAQNTCPVK